jgi:hypothetical protein
MIQPKTQGSGAGALRSHYPPTMTENDLTKFMRVGALICFCASNKRPLTVPYGP